jgi:hypothetical protein
MKRIVSSRICRQHLRLDWLPPARPRRCAPLGARCDVGSTSCWSAWSGAGCVSGARTRRSDAGERAIDVDVAVPRGALDVAAAVASA